MPRNGDGSSDNGPVEGHEILHGTNGDDSLQHTKHVAPMPEGEKGDTLPGFSGGGIATRTSTSDSKKRSEPHHASTNPTLHIQQKHSRLDAGEANIAGATSHAEAAHAREQRVKDAVGSEDVGKGAGGHADVEMLHGKARLDGGEGEKGREAELLQRKKAEKFGGVNLQDDEEADGRKNGASGTANGESGRHEETEANGGPVGHADGVKGTVEESFGTHNSSETRGKSKEHGHDVAHEADLLQRKKAEKFGGVNLGDDEADGSFAGKSKAHGSTEEGGAVGHADTKGHHNGDHVGAETQGKIKGHDHDVANYADQLQRNPAEKFGDVNLSEDSADASSGLKNNTRGSTDGGPVRHAHDTKDQDGESGAHSRGHVNSETHSKGNGHGLEGKKKDHGLDLANDADLLQRRKAEKFGGVNLGDD